MSATVEVVDPELVEHLEDLAIDVQTDKGNCKEEVEEINGGVCGTTSNNIDNFHGVCAICLNRIVLQETALVKGCEHAY